MEHMGFPTKSELKVMAILSEHPKGLYGLQIVEQGISRGSIYVLLGRLEDKGFINVERKSKGNHPGLARPLYTLNAAGRRVLLTAQSLEMLPVGG